MRLLFVCLGNICRSPTAEAVCRAKIENIQTDSAGTSGWHVGEPPYVAMQNTARTRGYDMSDLRARQFRATDFTEFELILGMDDANILDIEKLRPAGSITPVRKLTDFAPTQSMDHIPDPYYTRDFDGALDLIEATAPGLKNVLISRKLDV